MVPLDFRDVILGRLRPWGTRGLPSSWTEEDEDDVEEAELGMSTTGAAGSFTLGIPEGDFVAILCCTALLVRCSERLWQSGLLNERHLARR